MRYGYFDKQAREYVITRPDTPTPWINYIGAGGYGSIVSNTGGGYSFHRDPQHRRVTRYRYNSLPADRPGRYIYLRDQDTGVYWNPGYQPAGRKLDDYCCRHGLGYTVLSGEYQGMRGEVTYFVPDEKNFEIWLVRLRNNTHLKKTYRIFGYAEFCFWDAIKDQQNVDWVQQINQGRYEEGLITWYPHFVADNSSFFATGEPVHSFDTNLEAFIGRYRSEANPIAVEEGAGTNSLSYRQNGVGALCLELTLGRGEEREAVFILGFAEDRTKIRAEIEDYLRPEGARAALDRLKDHWTDFTSKLNVETPDEDMNLFLNTWNQYQCNTTFNWSRFVSLYQLGLGRGMGLRDSAQDVLGVLHAIPRKTKTLLTKLLSCQYPDGRAYHLYFPLTGEGGEGDAPIMSFDWYSDDHLWLIPAVNAYLKETGDFAFLETGVAYNDKQSEGTVLEHLERALAFTAAHRGPQGLALAGRADWNDTLNLDQGKGRAESVFTSMLYCRTLLELAELYAFLGRTGEAARCRTAQAAMAAAINAACWDGDWYIRAFDDEGVPLGAESCAYGKIFINTQSWAVLGGVAAPAQAERALAAVEDHLNTPYGLVAVYPAYPAFDPAKGGISTYPPGAKENGGIFVQTNPWVAMAETMLGRGDRAYRYYRQTMPAAHNDAADRFEVEPYVYPQNILGKEHPQAGVGRNSWLTGAAAWHLVLASQYILGIRPEYDRLTIDPCLPPSWKGFKARRVFRGAVYEIEVRNPGGVSKGVKELRVDGRVAEYVPIMASGTRHAVTVVMG